MSKFSYRRSQSLLGLLSLFVLFSSLYFEYVVGLQPCPLCIMQRVCVFLLLALTGLGVTTHKKAHIVCFFQILIALAGLYFAGRQLWLQSLPPGQIPACLPGLDVLIHYFPWQDVVKALVFGGGDCAESTWNLLGITMPGWAAMYFSFMTVANVFLFIRTRKSALPSDLN